MKKLFALTFLIVSIACSFTVVNATDYVMKEKNISTSQFESFKFLQFTPANQTAKLPLMI